MLERLFRVEDPSNEIWGVSILDFLEAFLISTEYQIAEKSHPITFKILGQEKHSFAVMYNKREREDSMSAYILYRKIMASLAGPVPIHLTPTPVYFSMNSMYFLAFSGRASYELMFVLFFQPGRVS